MTDDGAEPSVELNDGARDLWAHEFLGAPFAALAGAGISLAPPSNIPSANVLLAEVLDNPLLPLTSVERTKLWSALTPGNAERGDQYTFLRFEQVIEAMGQTVDPTLTSLRAAIPPAEPNVYHYALARLIRDGATVLTTNFDDLIEQACARLGFTCAVIVTELDYQQYRQSAADFRYPLFKLHGTFGAADTNHAHREVITEAGIIGAGTTATPYKWRVVHDILNAHDLLVLGYSGYDDFDVVPAIARSGAGRRLYWSRYAPGAERAAHQGTIHPNAPAFPWTGALHDDWIFNYLFVGSIFSRRGPADILMASEDTEQMIVRLLEARGLSAAPMAAASEVPQSACVAPAGRWPKPEFAPILAARLLQHAGDYDRASELLHAFVQRDDSDVLSAGRAHLWLAEMAADRHHLAAVECHIWRAVQLLDQVSLDELRTGDFTELLGFPFTRPLSTFELPRFGKSSTMTTDLSQIGIDNKLSLPIWRFGWECAMSIRACVQRGDLREAHLVAKVFSDSPDYHMQCEEVLADVSFWLAMAHAAESDQATSHAEKASALNKAAAHADRAARVFQRLQRRRKFIDALVLMGTMEAFESRDDWAKSTVEEIIEAATFTGSAYGLAGAFYILGLTEDPRWSDEAYQQQMERDEAEDVPCCAPASE